MHGPLSEIGLVEVLQLLERGRRSGTLRVTGPDPTAPRTLWLREGRIVALEPEAGDEAIDAGLVQRALAVAGDPTSSDHPALLPASTRERLRVRLAGRALGAMLHWSRGRFDFAEGRVDDGPLDLSADDVIFAVVDAEARRVELAAALDGFHLVPAFALPERLGEGGPVTLDATDWRLLDAIDGVRDVGALAALLGEPLEEIAERVRALLAAAILVPTAAPPDVALQARAAIEAGRYDDAVTLLRARVAAVPADGDAWRLLGLAEVGAGRFDRAIGAWESWSAADPGRTDEATSLTRAARTMVEALRETRD